MGHLIDHGKCRFMVYEYTCMSISENDFLLLLQYTGILFHFKLITDWKNLQIKLLESSSSPSHSQLNFLYPKRFHKTLQTLRLAGWKTYLAFCLTACFFSPMPSLLLSVCYDSSQTFHVYGLECAFSRTLTKLSEVNYHKKCTAIERY